MKKLLLFWFALLQLAVAQGQPTPREAVEARAERLYEAKNCAEAVKLYEKLLLQAPKNTTYLSRAAYCYFEEGKFQRAHDKYRLALLYTPVSDTENRALYTSNISACLDKQGEHEKAFEYAQQAYRLKENTFHLWNVLSVAWNLQKWNLILGEMARAKVETNNNFLFFTGAAYNGTGQHAQAIQTLETFLGNYDSNDEYPMQDFFPEARNYLLDSYRERLVNTPKNGDAERGRYLKGMAAVLQRGQDANAWEAYHQIFLRPLNICYIQKIPDALCEQLFDATMPRQLPAEKALAAYFVGRDYDTAYAATDRLLQSANQGALAEDLLITRYLAYLRMTFEDFFQNNAQLNEARLKKLNRLAQDYFRGRTHWTEEELFDERKITIGMGTVQVIQEVADDLKKVRPQENAEKLLMRVLATLPLNAQNSKGLAEILESYHKKQR